MFTKRVGAVSKSVNVGSPAMMRRIVRDFGVARSMALANASR